jgi:hypothetical protein
VLKAYLKRTHNRATFNLPHIDSNQLLPTDQHHRTIHTGASDAASNTERERIKPMVKRMKNRNKRTVKKIWFPLFDSLFVIQVNSFCYKVYGLQKTRWQYECKEMNVFLTCRTIIKKFWDRWIQKQLTHSDVWCPLIRYRSLAFWKTKNLCGNSHSGTSKSSMNKARS